MLADRSAMPAHKLKARIVSGRLQGEFDLHYRPWFKVIGSLEGTSWLAEAIVKLETDIGMKVIPALDFGASGDDATGVELTFRGGKLEHTAFTLKAPQPRLDVVFRAFAVLDAQLRAFKLLTGSTDGAAPSEDPGIQLLHKRSDPFPIVEGLQLPILGDQGTLDLEKGSAAKFNKKQIAPKPGEVGKSFAGDALKHLAWTWPFKKPTAAPGGERHTGKTEADAIPMTWYKPVSGYPKTLKRKRPGKKAQEINAFPHKHYSDGDVEFDMGVDGEFWPWEGKKLQRISEARGPAVGWLKEDLDTLPGLDLDSQLGYKAQIDHVQDLAWAGPDDERNLWPLEATANMKAGWEQNLKQEVTWLPEGAATPVSSSILYVPKGSWFVIEKITEPTGIAPQK
jgi:hypothetical protein